MHHQTLEVTSFCLPNKQTNCNIEEPDNEDEDEEEIYMVTSGRPVTVSAVITGIMDIHHIPGGRKGGNHDDSNGDDDEHQGM